MCCAGYGKREGRLEWRGEGVRRSSWAIVERDDFNKEKCKNEMSSQNCKRNMIS
jgi:hypothetical protein